MDNIKTVTMKLPTYLQTLLEENYSVNLVFQPQKGEDVDFVPKTVEANGSEDSTVLELTGNPLEVDLGGNDTICEDVIFETPTSWTQEEAQHYPLNLGRARKFMNKELMRKKPNQSIFCVCDGNDAQSTIGLGCKTPPSRICRILLYALPCCDENDEVTTLGYMKKAHMKNTSTDVKIKIRSKNTYNLFGCNLKNCRSLPNTEYPGYVSLEHSTTEVSGERETNSSAQMNFQIVLGHKKSPFANLWSDLCFLNSLINLLGTLQFDENAVINRENSSDYMEITSVISDLFHTVWTTNEDKKFDLENLRPVNLFDKLWDTIRACSTLTDLRDCFHFFFEEMATTENVFVQRLDKEKTTVSEITYGIIDGLIAVPTLSFSQSLELLIELGIEKLKKDYFTVITHFAISAKEIITKKWDELFIEKTVLQPDKHLQRKSRFTITSKAVVADLTITKTKVSFLCSMHKVCEFIYLYKDNLNVFGPNFDSYCKSLCDHFLVKCQKMVQINDFGQNRLDEFAFNISKADLNSLIDGKSRVAFSVKLFSVTKMAEVLTVFHFSQFPIVPLCVKEFEIGLDGDDVGKDKLYVLKLLQIVHLC